MTHKSPLSISYLQHVVGHSDFNSHVAKKDMFFPPNKIGEDKKLKKKVRGEGNTEKYCIFH